MDSYAIGVMEATAARRISIVQTSRSVIGSRRTIGVGNVFSTRATVDDAPLGVLLRAISRIEIDRKTVGEARRAAGPLEVEMGLLPHANGWRRRTDAEGDRRA